MILKTIKKILFSQKKFLLLFLDIDGVLHKSNTGHLNLINNLAGVISTLERKDKNLVVQIVISSNWKDSLSLEDLKETLPVLKERIIGVTPDCERHEHNQYDKREKEIEKWLRKNSKNFPRNFKFLAIDDDKKIFSTSFKNVFFTDNQCGLDELASQKLLKVLNEFI